MKALTLFLFLMSPVSAYAGVCSWYDQLIEYDASIGRLEPQYVSIREGDRICVRLRAIDGGYGITIATMPVWLKATTKKTDEVSFIARKTGSYEVKCTGCGTKSTLTVLSKTDYDKKAKKILEQESFIKRRFEYK